MRGVKQSLVFILAIASFVAVSCEKKAPNVLVVTFDTTRADHVGYAGGPERITPTLDALAKKGSWFSTCLTSQPLTLPAHTSIMTGLQPYHHGVRNNGGYVLRSDVVTLAERLRAAGYATHAIVSSFVLDSQFGLDQGFDQYDDDLSGGKSPGRFMFKEIKADRVADKALEWLQNERAADKPFLLWLHFYDAHADYDPPADVSAEFPGDRYSGEIHFADRELGRVVDRLGELGLLEKTLVVFAGDHGESLGEHRERSHGIFVYESTTHVPLFFSGPGVPKGQRIDALARSVDITPTVLDLLGLGEETSLDGRTLSGMMAGDEEAPRAAYSESLAPLINFGWSELRTERVGSLKVIEAPRREVYDLASDPKELHNLAATGSSLPVGARKMIATLHAVANEDPFSRGEQAAGAVDPETKKKLAALGYVFATPTRAEGPRADPKDRIDSWEEFQRAQGLVRNKRYDEAVAAIDELLKVDSENSTAMLSLGNALKLSRHPAEALAVFKRVIALDPSRNAGYFAAARVALEMGRIDEAEELGKVTQQLDPESPEALTLMGDIYLEQKRFDDAARVFRKAFEIDPTSSTSISGLGNCLNRLGRLKEAVDVLRRGIEKDPESQAIVYNLAVVTERMGDSKGALALYRMSLRIDADHSMTWNNLGSLLDRLGQRDKALDCVRQAHELDPDNVEATYNLGALMLVTGKPAEALSLLDDAIRARPSLLPAAVRRASALEALGRTDEALESLHALTDAHPGAWLGIAKLELKRGHTDAARRALREALAKAPRLAEAARNDPQLRGLLPPS